jgi:Uncharacterized conserved protein
MTTISIKRVYDSAAASDGLRLLVDRLWPRGLSKDEAAVDRWLRDIAPSPALRQWFGHDPAKWPEFQRRYVAELNAMPDAPALLQRLLQDHKHVTLLYAAKDEAHNHAIVLADYLRQSTPSLPRRTP